MGCDIHMFAERKDENMKWHAVKGDDGKIECFDCGRNYNLFAILADVRNGHGFAGTPTGTGFDVKYPARGLPSDLSDDLCQDLESYTDDDDWDHWLGDHSFSYLTVSEILALDFNKRSTLTGVISFHEYVKWAYKSGRSTLNSGPDSYCGGVSGAGVEIVDVCIFKDKYANLSQDAKRSIVFDRAAKVTPTMMNKKQYATVSWQETYSNSLKYFFQTTVMPLLSECTSNGLSHDDVRIVFGFDS